jgi:hypothetical protein
MTKDYFATLVPRAPFDVGGKCRKGSEITRNLEGDTVRHIESCILPSDLVIVVVFPLTVFSFRNKNDTFVTFFFEDLDRFFSVGNDVSASWSRTS